MIELRHLSLNPRDTDPDIYGHRVALSEGFAGVIRVANEIRVAGIDLGQFRALPVTNRDHLWSVEFICQGERDSMEQLRKRLYRIPTVVRVHCWRVASLPM